MPQESFNLIASRLIYSYIESSILRRGFLEKYGSPPTLMATAHLMRSVLLADLVMQDRFEVGREYAEFGRVAYTDSHSGEQFLLRSSSAQRIETTSQTGPELFPVDDLVTLSPVKLLFYEFAKSGLKLSLSGSIQLPDSRRLRAFGAPVELGLWQYAPDADDLGTASTFDQDVADAFDEIGDIDLDQEEVGH